VELLNITHDLLNDILTSWHIGTHALLANVIGGKQAKDYASLIIDVADGAKHRSNDIKEMRKAADTAIALILRD
jgi:hypothetical protein